MATLEAPYAQPARPGRSTRRSIVVAQEPVAVRGRARGRHRRSPVAAGPHDPHRARHRHRHRRDGGATASRRRAGPTCWPASTASVPTCWRCSRASRSSARSSALVQQGAMVRRIGRVENAAALATVDATVRRTDKIPSGETGGISVRAAETTLVDTLGATLKDGRFLDDASAQIPDRGARQRRGCPSSASTRSRRRSRRLHSGGSGSPSSASSIRSSCAPGLDQSVVHRVPLRRRRGGCFGHRPGAPPPYLRARPDPACRRRRRGRAPVRRPTRPQPGGASQVSQRRPSALAARASAGDDALTALLLGLGGVAACWSARSASPT